jgi:energy-converting hydrogenase Eha subunit E
MTVAALMTVSFLLSLILRTQYLSTLWKKLFSKIFHSSSLIFGFLGIGLVLVIQIFTDSQVLNQFGNWISDFPVLSLLKSGLSNESSGTRDNVLVRFSDAINISMPPSDVSLLGEGMGINWVLGSQEFGIRAIWVECGLVGGCFILLAFSGIIYLFLNVAVRAILSAQPLKVIIFSIPLLIIMSGLMTGLTVLYELSSGLLLWISVGAINQYLYQPIPKYQPLSKEKFFSR